VTGTFPRDAFADLLDANREFVSTFTKTGLSGSAAQGLAIVTCMDSRIAPLEIMGLKAGDAKILRNAAARVTEDVLRTLVLATYLLDVSRILVMPHTDCRMAKQDEAAIHEEIKKNFDVDTRSLEFRTTSDPIGSLAIDVNRIRAYPLLPNNVVVGGAMYDVATGELSPVEC
jgi:carbonic anhydrase